MTSKLHREDKVLISKVTENKDLEIDRIQIENANHLKESILDLEKIGIKEDSIEMKKTAFKIYSNFILDNILKIDNDELFIEMGEKVGLEKLDLESIKEILQKIINEFKLSDTNILNLIKAIENQPEFKLGKEIYEIIEKRIETEEKINESLYQSIIQLNLNEKNTVYLEKSYILAHSAGHILTSKLYTELITYFSNNNRLLMLRYILEDIKANEGVLDIKLYGSLMSGFGKLKQLDIVLDIYKDFEKKGYAPDQYIFGSLIYAFNKNGRKEQALKFYNMLPKFNIASNVNIDSMMLQSKCDDPEGALMFYEQLKLTKKMEPNIYIYNTLISLHLKNDDVSSALKVKDEMIKEGVTPNSITYCSFMTFYSGKYDISSTLEIIDMMNDEGVTPTIENYNILIRLYLHLDKYEEALKLFNSIPEAASNVTSNLHFLKYYSRRDHSKMLELFESIKQKDMPLNNSVIDTVLYTCFKKKDIRLMLQTFNEMKIYGLTPDISIYNMMLRATSIYLNLEETEKIYKSILDNLDIVTPTTKSYNYLLYSYLKAGKIELAQELIDQVFLKQTNGGNTKPNVQTLSILLRGLGKLKKIELVEFYFNTFTSPPISLAPDLQTLEAVLFSYFKAREFTKAKAVYNNIIFELENINKINPSTVSLYLSILGSEGSLSTLQEEMEAIKNKFNTVIVHSTQVQAAYLVALVKCNAINEAIVYFKGLASTIPSIFPKREIVDPLYRSLIAKKMFNEAVSINRYIDEINLK
ncbi:hypothetical protein K502DRAFT_326700 [Neoconidiobolus thromboides FSU 785]|nr:hypothetical protein K502DRAFT_326700 [Neoconidiobolus thromboides FSU 785]